VFFQNQDRSQLAACHFLNLTFLFFVFANFQERERSLRTVLFCDARGPTQDEQWDTCRSARASSF